MHSRRISSVKTTYIMQNINCTCNEWRDEEIWKNERNKTSILSWSHYHKSMLQNTQMEHRRGKQVTEYECSYSFTLGSALTQRGNRKGKSLSFSDSHLKQRKEWRKKLMLSIIKFAKIRTHPMKRKPFIYGQKLMWYNSMGSRQHGL